jgi:hypothetical protein
MPEAYRKSLSFEDIGFAADKALLVDTWNRVAALSIPAGTLYALGRVIDGFVAAILKDTSNVTQYGSIRLVASNPEETRKQVLIQFHTRSTTDLADKTKMVLAPLTKPFIKADSKLILEIDPDAAFTLDFGLTFSRLDFTVFITQ